jgi:hypothetical protein
MMHEKGAKKNSPASMDDPKLLILMVDDVDLMLTF